jgi:hypothetical protein
MCSAAALLLMNFLCRPGTLYLYIETGFTRHVSLESLYILEMNMVTIEKAWEKLSG